MPKMPEPPPTFQDFIARYPKLGEAWSLAREGAEEGPLDERTRALVKLAIAIGAMRQGAVHAAVRKALAARVKAKEIDQVVALAASTLGFPSAVAVFSWVREEVAKTAPARSRK